MNINTKGGRNWVNIVDLHKIQKRIRRQLFHRAVHSQSTNNWNQYYRSVRNFIVNENKENQIFLPPFIITFLYIFLVPFFIADTVRTFKSINANSKNES